MFAIGWAGKRYEHEMKRSGEYRPGLDMEGTYEDFFFLFFSSRFFYSCITKS